MPKSALDINLEVDDIKAFVLGTYGTGKSIFASSFPTKGYLFDFDQRAKTYRGKDWEYDTYPLTALGWIQFEKNIKEVKKKVFNGTYKSVSLDSATSMTDCAMARALQIDPKRSDEGGPLWNVHFMIVKNLMEPKLKEILSWPCNIILTGHWDIKTDPKNGNIISIDPLLTGQMSAKIPGYFDEVYMADCGTKEGKEFFFIRTTSWGHYRSRSTISGKLQLLPARIPNDYASLMHYAKEAQEKEKELNQEKVNN